MDTEITQQVLSATARQTANGKTIYDIALGDGNTYGTFNGALFTKAQQLQGQQASARVSVKQNGQYTNFYLNDIAPLGQLAPASGPVATPAPSNLPLAPAISPASRGGGMTPEREQKIVKQSSFATAFNFVASLYQGAGETELEAAKEHAHSLARELYGHVMSEPKLEQTLEQEAAALPGATLTSATSDNGKGDGIPW